MAHFEQFRHYHETFYAQVEALSVTPYSETALERGLMGVLVSVARVVDAGLRTRCHRGGGRARSSTRCDGRQDHQLLADLAARAGLSPDDPTRESRRQADPAAWTAGTTRRRRSRRRSLVYERMPTERGRSSPLLISPENAVTTPAEKVFVVANSMREVQPEINLLVSPSPDRLAFNEPLTAARVDLPEEES